MESSQLINGTAGAMSGTMRLDVICSDGSVPPCAFSGDQEDDRIIFSTTDVRCRDAGPGCSAAGADYEGLLLVRLRLRITDHSNRFEPPVLTCPNGTGAAPCVTATVQDFQISIPVQCVNNGGANGGNCALTTTLDTLEPGSVNELQRQIMEIRLFAVTDVGPDGSIAASPSSDPLGLGCPPICGSGDEERFLKAGWFNN
jgi:hypothetical protein